MTPPKSSSTKASRRLAALAFVAFARTAAAQLPSSSLAVRRDDHWQQWWRSDAAPAAWRAADDRLAGAIRWRIAAPGVEWGELRLGGSGEAWRVRAVVVRIDPARVRWRLVERATSDGSRGAWTVDSAPRSAIVAFNAGQFVGGSPWGWVAASGAVRYSAGRGPLSSVFVVDTAGRARLGDGRAAEQLDARTVRVGFQSYPTLLTGDGDVPGPLRAPDLGVDVAHRDARLALGVLRDGRVLLALTRFDALGGTLSEAPFGLTSPEMAALMGALGCREAVALDGGISAQLLVRTRSGVRTWRGLRKVPLAVVLEPR